MALLKRNRILNAITNNWVAKIVSIAIAIVLFAFHRMTGLETLLINVPLTVETNSSLVPAGAYPDSVKVSLRGNASGIPLIQEDDVDAVLDMKKYDTAGLFQEPVQIRTKGNALGIDPLEIKVTPAAITLRLDWKGANGKEEQ